MTPLPEIIHLERTTSTNEIAMAAARQPRDQSPHGSMWSAEEQTAGRGHRHPGQGGQRAWHSPPGVNLYTSLLLRPDMTPDTATGLTLAAAAGLWQAIAEQAEDIGASIEGLWVKWPNDLWFKERKLAGILTQGVVSEGALQAVVIGMGVNVNMRQIPEGLSATSLARETGVLWDRARLLERIRVHVMRCASSLQQRGLSPILEILSAHDGMAGRRVEVDVNGCWRKGRAERVNARGHLEVTLDGQTSSISVQTGEARFIT